MRTGRPGACLVEQGGVKARAQVPALDVEDGLERDVQDGGDRCRVLTAMQRSRMRARVWVLAVVVARLLMVVKERSSVLGSLIGCAGLAMLKGSGKARMFIN